MKIVFEAKLRKLPITLPTLLGPWLPCLSSRESSWRLLLYNTYRPFRNVRASLLVNRQSFQTFLVSQIIFIELYLISYYLRHKEWCIYSNTSIKPKSLTVAIFDTVVTRASPSPSLSIRRSGIFFLQFLERHVTDFKAPKPWKEPHARLVLGPKNPCLVRQAIKSGQTSRDELNTSFTPPANESASFFFFHIIASFFPLFTSFSSSPNSFWQRTCGQTSTYLHTLAYSSKERLVSPPPKPHLLLAAPTAPLHVWICTSIRRT